MDIVLELTDTFIADYAYAYFAPARPAPYDFPHATAANGSAQTFSTWTYKPATKFIQVQPSQTAYNTSMPRDSPLRQLITLFWITWYVVAQPCNGSCPCLTFSLQDLWHHRLLHLRHSVILPHLRQAHHPPSQVHQEPDLARDQAGQQVDALHGRLHRTPFPPRSPRLRQAL